ncbi:DMT family transporter [Ferrimonas senticii]|uniref:DMT family transporter n=1 Tax=Ferrimonas senticii TaxID=394566 RepID=UPI000408C974|nr:DMT family transporter [Ferrimonas senticii]
MNQVTAGRFSQTNGRLFGFLLAVAAAVLMSFDPVFIRFSGVSGFDTAFLFGLFSAISMTLMLQWQDPRGVIGAIKAGGFALWLSAGLMLISGSGLVLSIKHTTVANTFVILSATPALSALFSWLWFREATSRRTWLAIVSVMVGILIVVSGSAQSGNWLGDGLALIAVSALSLLQTVMRRYPEVSRMASVGLGSALIALVMGLLAEPSSYSLNTWLVMAAMGLLSAPFGRVLAQVATRHITAAEVGMVLLLETVLAPLWAFGFFGEVPGYLSLIGGGLIFATIALYVYAESK